MNVVCLDLEGVLVPEIWIAFAEESGIPELKRTTRDEPDYDKLMKYRIEILKEHGLGLKEIQNTIEKIDPLPGAKEFLDALRERTQVLILSDTFTQYYFFILAEVGFCLFNIEAVVCLPILLICIFPLGILLLFPTLTVFLKTPLLFKGL